MRKIASSFRKMAIDMGGVMIKVGQFLSSRVDVLPEQVTEILAGLQDEVPPENIDDILKVAEGEFEAPIESQFEEFESKPMAAASLGQVHRAKLRILNQAQELEGEPDHKAPESIIADVVVKIQRPNIRHIIATDMAALRTVGSWLNRFSAIRKRADVPALLEEFSRILYEEIDYIAEGNNAEAFAENFDGRPGIRIPKVYWSHTTKRVLTLEDVYAIKITDFKQIEAAGISLVDVADRLFEAYMEQIFSDGFFHADPHPGNLFVEPRLSADSQSQEWLLTFVDFGMVGRVPSELREGLRDLVIGLGTQDPKRMVSSYQKMGVLLPHADLELLEQMEAAAFDRFWGKSMAELRLISHKEMHDFAREFRDVIFTMPFQIPQDLIFLGRTVAILAGICIGLNPEFSPAKAFMPAAQRLIQEEGLSSVRVWFDEFVKLLQSMITVPRRLEEILDKLDRGAIEVEVPSLAQQVTRLDSAVRKMVGALIFAALLMGGVQLYLADFDQVSIYLFTGALIALIWTIFSR
jgi:predicted unusual protein kinase regulating ubiquinone biosynthesis (AarF/ABC1/UbiB family)